MRVKKESLLSEQPEWRGRGESNRSLKDEA